MFKFKQYKSNFLNMCYKALKKVFEDKKKDKKLLFSKTYVIVNFYMFKYVIINLFKI